MTPFQDWQNAGMAKCRQIFSMPAVYMENTDRLN